MVVGHFSSKSELFSSTTGARQPSRICRARHVSQPESSGQAAEYSVEQQHPAPLHHPEPQIGHSSGGQPLGLQCGKTPLLDSEPLVQTGHCVELGGGCGRNGGGRTGTSLRTLTAPKIATWSTSAEQDRTTHRICSGGCETIHGAVRLRTDPPEGAPALIRYLARYMQNPKNARAPKSGGADGDNYDAPTARRHFSGARRRGIPTGSTVPTSSASCALLPEAVWC